jgi:hypothetical protein
MAVRYCPESFAYSAVWAHGSAEEIGAYGLVWAHRLSRKNVPTVLCGPM